MNTHDNFRVVFTERQKAELLQDKFDLTQCLEHEVVGKTLVSVISSGSERGGYMDYYNGNNYPSDTGYAVVMEVIAVGEAVKGINPGDYVFSQAPHQLYNRVTDDNVVIVPKGMSPEHAVLCRFPAVSMTAMIQTDIKPVEPVVVTGLGVIGMTCAQMMQHCGYDVYAIDPVKARRDAGTACGLRHVLESFEQIPELCGKVGLVIECSGSEQATYTSLDYLRKAGELFLVGVPWRRTTEVYAHEILRKIFSGYLKVSSGWEWSLPRHPADFLPYSNYGSFEKAMQWIRDGFIKVDGIYQVADPHDCDSIYQLIATDRLEKTCAMFDWRSF